MRMRLPRVWSSRCAVKLPALATLVSGLYTTLRGCEEGVRRGGQRQAGRLAVAEAVAAAAPLQNLCLHHLPTLIHLPPAPTF